MDCNRKTFLKKKWAYDFGSLLLGISDVAIYS
jgi:hypothetical protein